jgi:hypothetical protein
LTHGCPVKKFRLIYASAIQPKYVILGLDPRIHVSPRGLGLVLAGQANPRTRWRQRVDGRVKPGHDEFFGDFDRTDSDEIASKKLNRTAVDRDDVFWLNGWVVDQTKFLNRTRR